MLNGGLRTTKQTQNEKHTLVSVVTVVYNDVSHIEETIQSVLNQTFSDIEYIVVDGNSKDGTLDVIRKYEDRITYWQSEPDKGVYDAMNKAISLCNGEWVSFMNSGDSFTDEHVIENVFASKSYTASVVYGKTNMVYPFGTVVYEPKKPCTGVDHMPFNHQSCFTRLSELKLYGFNLKYRICGDFDFYYTLLKKNAEFEYVDLIIANYEASNGISSVTPYKFYKESFEITNKRNWKIRYFFLCIKIYVRSLIKKILPKSFVAKYRENKILQKSGSL